MTKNIDPQKELDSLQASLSELYRGGTTDQIQVKRLWDRVEVLERELGVEK